MVLQVTGSNTLTNKQHNLNIFIPVWLKKELIENVLLKTLNKNKYNLTV